MTGRERISFNAHPVAHIIVAFHFILSHEKLWSTNPTNIVELPAGNNCNLFISMFVVIGSVQSIQLPN